MKTFTPRHDSALREIGRRVRNRCRRFTRKLPDERTKNPFRSGLIQIATGFTDCVAGAILFSFGIVPVASFCLSPFVSQNFASGPHGSHRLIRFAKTKLPPVTQVDIEAAANTTTDAYDHPSFTRDGGRFSL